MMVESRKNDTIEEGGCVLRNIQLHALFYKFAAEPRQTGFPFP